MEIGNRIGYKPLEMYPDTRLKIDTLVDLHRNFHKVAGDFPELLVMPEIQIGMKNTMFTMMALARWDRNRQRIYGLVIGCGSATQIPYDHLPQVMRKAIIAHELCHFLQYERLSDWGLIKFALKYKYSSKFRRAVEHEADMMAIERGYGRGLIEFAKHCYYAKHLTKRYSEVKNTIYMSWTELEEATVLHEARVYSSKIKVENESQNA